MTASVSTAKATKKAGKTVKRVAKKAKRTVLEGIACISASFNNTIVTITDPHGQVIAQKSSAGCGYRGSRKSTPHAAGEAAEKAGRAAVDDYKMQSVKVKVSGPGQGREAAIRSLVQAGLKVLSITDVTRIPHNGAKQPKKRRV